MNNAKDGKSIKIKASDHPSYALFTFLAVVFPYIALIVGIVLALKDKPLDKKLGEHVIAFSILFMILWGFLYVTFIDKMFSGGAYLY